MGRAAPPGHFAARPTPNPQKEFAMYDGFGYSYWPPFFDPSPPNSDEGRPPYVLRPVTTFTSDGEISTVNMPIPCYYL